MRRSVPPSHRCVAKPWRKVWDVTRLSSPARADNDLAALQVRVLDAQTEQLHQPRAAAIHEFGHEARGGLRASKRRWHSPRLRTTGTRREARAAVNGSK